MKAMHLLLICTAGLRAVQLSQLIDATRATSGGPVKTSFKRTFQPLPVKFTITSQGAEEDAKECQWAVDELKKASLENEGLRSKISASEKKFADQENSLIERLENLQETYQQLYNKYKSLKAASKPPRSAGPTIEDCLSKVKDNGWTCTNIPPTTVASNSATT